MVPRGIVWALGVLIAVALVFVETVPFQWIESLFVYKIHHLKNFNFIYDYGNYFYGFKVVILWYVVRNIYLVFVSGRAPNTLGISWGWELKSVFCFVNEVAPGEYPRMGTGCQRSPPCDYSWSFQSHPWSLGSGEWLEVESVTASDLVNPVYIMKPP